MPIPLVLDTSVYIEELRGRELDIITKRRTDSHVLWISAVVLEELYVGASDRKSLRILTKLEHDFSKVERLLVPNQTDWINTGKILNKIGQQYGFDRVRKSKLSNDVLLAISSKRIGSKLVTANAKDFQLISEFLNLDWEKTT